MLKVFLRSSLQTALLYGMKLGPWKRGKRCASIYLLFVSILSYDLK